MFFLSKIVTRPFIKCDDIISDNLGFVLFLFFPLIMYSDKSLLRKKKTIYQEIIMYVSFERNKFSKLTNHFLDKSIWIISTLLSLLGRWAAILIINVQQHLRIEVLKLSKLGIGRGSYQTRPKYSLRLINLFWNSMITII